MSVGTHKAEIDAWQQAVGESPSPSDAEALRIMRAQHAELVTARHAVERLYFTMNLRAVSAGQIPPDDFPAEMRKARVAFERLLETASGGSTLAATEARLAPIYGDDHDYTAELQRAMRR